MINVTKSTRAPDDQHLDRSHVWSQVHTEKQDAGYLVEQKSPMDTHGASMLLVCLRGELYVAARWLHVCERCHVNSYEHNVLDFWKRVTCQDPQCVNNQISFRNGREVKCCVVSSFSFLSSLFSFPAYSFLLLHLLQRPVSPVFCAFSILTCLYQMSKYVSLKYISLCFVCFLEKECLNF